MYFKKYIPFYRRNLKVALPIMVTQAGQVIVQLADNIMVGHVGTNELAGVSFANSLIIIGMVFCTGFTMGSTPLIGQEYGKGNFRKAAGHFQNSIIADLGISALVTAVMTLIGIMMPFMGQEPEVLHFARQYYYLTIISLIPTIMFFCIRQFSEGIGITKYAMYLTLASNVLNIFLNWVFIYGKLGSQAMGVQGAALATLISRILMLGGFIMLLFTVYPYRHYMKYFSKQAITKNSIKKVLVTSFPLSIQSLTEITAFSFSTIMVGWLGATTLAGHQIAQSLSGLSFMIALGIGSAATIRVSHQFGEGKYEDAGMAGTASIHLSMAMMGTAAIIFLLLRNFIPTLYTSDRDVTDIAANLLIMVGIYQIFDALQLASMASLRALADVKVPMYLSAISYYLVCIPLGYICGFILGMGVYGVWAGLAAGLLFAGILFSIRFKRLINRIIAEKRQTTNR